MNLTPLRYIGICLLGLCLACQPSREEHAIETQKKLPSEYLFAQRAYPYSTIDVGAQRAALRFRQQQVAAARQRSQASWELVGPINIGGRVTDVEMPSDSKEVIYVGAASGGIFKSVDAGLNFEPIFDDQPSLAIGDIAIAPSDPNILYAGTGEPNAGGGSVAYDGTGIYRSDNGGSTWQPLGLARSGSISKIEIHPDDPDVVYVAAMGPLFSNGGERGVYKTTDGGASWNRVLFVSNTTGAIDLVMHPSNPEVLYAATWERVRRVDRLEYAGPNSGIHRSTDGGATWEKLTNGLPFDGGNYGRISLAIAPSEPDWVYASVVNETSFLHGVYQSKDRGMFWEPLATEGIRNVPYMWWFGGLEVDPNDAESLFYQGFDGHEYVRNQQRWKTIFEGQHVDQHPIFIHPQDSDFVISGNDGGIYISRDGGTNYEKVFTLPITQFYTIRVDPTQPNRLYGGSQDNGTVRSTSGEAEDWEPFSGGDGFITLIPDDGSNRVYASSQYGNLFTTDDDGASFSSTFIRTNVQDRRNWKTPVVLDPADPKILYYGTYRVWKSQDASLTWTAISPDLTRGDAGQNGYIYGTLTTISVSPLDSKVIWTGSDDGTISLSRDGGANWDRLSETPQRWVTKILADPNDPARAYYTLSGYRFGEAIGHIYRTDDYGRTWKDITANLPDIPVNDVVIHPTRNELYLATDIGVYRSASTPINWELLGNGLPSVVVNALDLDLTTGRLVAGTYGRSAYALQVEEVVRTEQVNEVSFWARILPNPVRERARLRIENVEREQFDILLFDAQGKLVRSVFQGILPIGEQWIEIPTASLPAGAYYCSIANQRQKRQLRLLKVD